jgi:hypothetical protein
MMPDVRLLYKCCCHRAVFRSAYEVDKGTKGIKKRKKQGKGIFPCCISTGLTASIKYSELNGITHTVS